MNENIKQSFGKNLSFRVDTNSTNDHDGNPDNGVQIKYDNPDHSLQRDVIVKTKGFYLSGEYRSYIKTYNQKIGDAPRGWYEKVFRGKISKILTSMMKHHWKLIMQWL